MSVIQRDPTLNKQLLMQQQIADLPANTALVVMQVERANTAADSTNKFFGAIKRIQQDNTSTKPHVVLMLGVGLRVSGRRSLFDLLFFPRTSLMAAIDARDPRYVGTVTLTIDAHVVRLESRPPRLGLHE